MQRGMPLPLPAGKLALYATLLVAQAHWHGAVPDCGMPYITVGGMQTRSADGEAVEESCAIRLPRRYIGPWHRVCVTVTHEYGHLLGYDHNSGDEVMRDPGAETHDCPHPLWFRLPFE